MSLHERIVRFMMEFPPDTQRARDRPMMNMPMATHPGYLKLLYAAHDKAPHFLALIELHEPWAVIGPPPEGKILWWNCHAEQPGGHEWEWPEAPCETLAIIAEELGVSISTATIDGEVSPTRKEITSGPPPIPGDPSPGADCCIRG